MESSHVFQYPCLYKELRNKYYRCLTFTEFVTGNPYREDVSYWYTDLNEPCLGQMWSY